MQCVFTLGLSKLRLLLPQVRDFEETPRSQMMFAARRIPVATRTVAGGILLFSLMAWEVQTQGLLFELDWAISAWMQIHTARLMTLPLLAITHVHDTVGILVMSAVLGGFLAWQGRTRELIFLAVTVGGGTVLNMQLKLMFARARPAFEDPIVSLVTFSFPSGPAASSTLFYGCLIVLFANTKGWRGPLIIVGATMIVLVGLSRIYLGAHYLSDVLAGITVGLVWLNLWRSILRPGAPASL